MMPPPGELEGQDCLQHRSLVGIVVGPKVAAVPLLWANSFLATRN
jgi:hypothetical protein